MSTNPTKADSGNTDPAEGIPTILTRETAGREFLQEQTFLNLFRAVYYAYGSHIYDQQEELGYPNEERAGKQVKNLGRLKALIASIETLPKVTDTGGNPRKDGGTFGKVIFGESAQDEGVEVSQLRLSVIKYGSAVRQYQEDEPKRQGGIRDPQRLANLKTYQVRIGWQQVKRVLKLVDTPYGEQRKPRTEVLNSIGIMINLGSDLSVHSVYGFVSETGYHTDSFVESDNVDTTSLALRGNQALVTYLETIAT